MYLPDISIPTLTTISLNVCCETQIAASLYYACISDQRNLQSPTTTATATTTTTAAAAATTTTLIIDLPPDRSYTIHVN